MRREHTLKNYWLQLISAAMDINMNLNESRVFADYSPHVEYLELRFFEDDWKPYGDNIPVTIKKEDKELLSLMECVAKGEKKYEELYEYIKMWYN